VSSGNSTTWENCPSDFVEKLKGFINGGHTLQGVSIGCDGDWFIRTDKCVSWKASGDDVVSHTVRAVEYAKTIGVDFSYNDIKSITFVPGSNGCICVGRASDGTAACLLVGDGIPPSLAALLADVPPTTAVQSVSVGFGGSWVVILENRSIYFDGISMNLKQKLQSLPSAIQSISLSLSHPEHYLIDFADGDTSCLLEGHWLPAVSEETRTCALRRVQLASAQAANMRARRDAQIMVNTSAVSALATMADAVW